MDEKKVKTKPEAKEEKKPEELPNPLVLENEELKKQVEDYKDKWTRSVAEFDNYKKRNAKIWQDAFMEGANGVILKILPVGDNLEYALSMELDAKTMEGVKNIKKKFDETLNAMGVEEINPIGQVFDPNVAEAVMQVEGVDGEASDTVKTVLQKGYKLNNKIIRYAKVSVVK